MKLTPVIIIIFFLIYSCSGGLENKNHEENDVPAIAFKDSIYNFGSVDIGDEVTHDFLFRNAGNRNLVIKEVEAGCVCTSVPYYTAEVISPGDTGCVRIKLETAGLFGYQAKSILIKSNAKNEIKRLIVKAYVE